MIAVPGAFHTGRMIRYQRYEPQVAEGLMQMFVAGVSTQKVGEATQTLMGISPSSNRVSRLNQAFNCGAPCHAARVCWLGLSVANEGRTFFIQAGPAPPVAGKCCGPIQRTPLKFIFS